MDFKLLPYDSANCILWILEKKLLGLKALLSPSQCSTHTASGSRLPTACSPKVLPSSWCPPRAMSHVAPHTEIPRNTQGFPATFQSLYKTSPSYCESAAKSLWLQSFWKLGKQRKIALIFLVPWTLSKVNGYYVSIKEVQGQQHSTLHGLQEQPELGDTLQVSWAVSEAVSGLGIFTMWPFIPAVSKVNWSYFCFNLKWLWCWFPSGWACARPRPLWVSPRTSPVRLGKGPIFN